MESDVTSVLLATAGIAVAILFAILAGVASANVFFDASREVGEKHGRPH